MTQRSIEAPWQMGEGPITQVVTAWGSGTRYWMQGKSICGLYKSYNGMVRRGTKDWERKGLRWFEEGQV